MRKSVDELAMDEINCLDLLQRTDYYEISGNRMTSYSSTLGGGSINYWDGKLASFVPYLALCDQTAFVQVLDAEHRMNLLQQRHHFWRPDKVVTKYHTHKGCHIEEIKTIQDDTFVSCMDFHSECAVDLVVMLSGVARGASRVRHEDNMLVIEEVMPVGNHAKDWGAKESRIFKVLGFNRLAHCEIQGRKYQLEFPLSMKNPPPSACHTYHENIVLIVAAADTETEAVAKYRRAMAAPQVLFDARKRYWEEYFRIHVPRFYCDNPAVTKMYYFIFYMVASNIYDFGEGYFKHPFESTGKYRLFAQWFWDSAFGAINEKWLNGLALPKSSMTNTLEAQRKDGLLPFALCRDSYYYGPQEVIQPFILPMAIWDYYLKSADRPFLDKALPVLIRLDDWMMKNRDANGEDLVNLQVPGESGWDNSKRYILHPHLVQSESPMIKEKRFVQSPDFNTYVYIGRKLMARMARELKKEALTAEYEAKASRTLEGVLSMWNESVGLFMDRFEEGHEEIPIRTPGGAIPLLAGLTDGQQIEKIVKNLTDPSLFWTEFPVTSLDLTDPDYNDTDEYFSYWNGRVWPQVNWLVAEGLIRVGQFNVARELVRKSICLCLATGEPWCNETYHPRTGYPYFTHNALNYVWGGLFNDMLLRHVAGIQPNAPANEVIINPLLNEDLSRLSLKDIRIGDHILDMSLEKCDGNGVRLKLRHRGAHSLTLITSAGQTSVHNASVELNVTTFRSVHWLEL